MTPADFADLLSGLAVSGARSREALAAIGESGPENALLVIFGENGAVYLQCEQTDPAACAAILSVALEGLVWQRLKEPNPHPSMVALHAALVGRRLLMTRRGTDNGRTQG